MCPIINVITKNTAHQGRADKGGRSTPGAPNQWQPEAYVSSAGVRVTMDRQHCWQISMHIKITLRKNHVYSCVITCICGCLLPTEVYLKGVDWYSILFQEAFCGLIRLAGTGDCTSHKWKASSKPLGLWYVWSRYESLKSDPIAFHSEVRRWASWI